MRAVARVARLVHRTAVAGITLVLIVRAVWPYLSLRLCCATVAVVARVHDVMWSGHFLVSGRVVVLWCCGAVVCQMYVLKRFDGCRDELRGRSFCSPQNLVLEIVLLVGIHAVPRWLLNY